MSCSAIMLLNCYLLSFACKETFLIRYFNLPPWHCPKHVDDIRNNCSFALCIAASFFYFVLFANRVTVQTASIEVSIGFLFVSKYCFLRIYFFDDFSTFVSVLL